GTAAGMSMEGLIPFACSFAVFLTNRAYDFLRISVCYNNRNVKVIGSHGGITVGEDGATAQCLEDFAITRVLPNITIVYPMDAVEMKKATRVIAETEGPVYMRLGRPPFPILTGESDEFVLGKANIMREGRDATIIACGLMVYESLQAAEVLAQENIQVRVLNMHTIKPIDVDAIVQSAQTTGAVVTAEEHQINGGLGSAVAEVLGRNLPVPIEMVAVNDTFGESGTPEELLIKYHLKDTDIAKAVKKVLERKKRS
ncbi:transketolase family protein, partial [bacterium]